MGQELTNDEVETMFKDANTSGTGKINFAEFMKIMSD